MSRRRIMQSLDQRYELPDGYTRVNYLENNGKKHIDIGVSVDVGDCILISASSLDAKITIQ